MLKYLFTVSQNVGDDFKSEIMQKIEGEDNRFRLYCEKILIDL